MSKSPLYNLKDGYRYNFSLLEEERFEILDYVAICWPLFSPLQMLEIFVFCPLFLKTDISMDSKLFEMIFLLYHLGKYKHSGKMRLHKWDYILNMMVSYTERTLESY